jgi:tetratricopeptide (TPR) repeat protein
MSINDFDTAIHMYQKILKYKNDNKYIILHLDLYKNEMKNMDYNEQIGICYYQQKKFDLAARHFLLAVNTPQTVVSLNENTRIFDLNMKIGWCFEQTCQYELALQHYKISLEMSEKDASTDNDAITRLYLRISHMYKCTNQKKLAYNYYIEGIKRRDNVDTTDKRQMVAFHGDLIKYCHENYLYELTIYHFEHVLQLGKELNDLVLVRTIYPPLANHHAKYMEQYDIAAKYIKEAIDICLLITPSDQREIEKLTQNLWVYEEMQHNHLHKLYGYACTED